MNIILTTALVIAAAVAFFSILLTISGKYFISYGKFKIIVNDHTQFMVKGGDTLFEALEANAIQIPVLCGGKGTCGSCKVKVVEGSGKLLPIEEIHLSEDDKQKGYRLSCQYRVTNDLRIILPDELMTANLYQSTIVGFERITDDIRLVRLKIATEHPIQIDPVQYIRLICPVFTNTKSSIKRDYFIGTYDSIQSCVDLYVKHVPEGICSSYFHEQIKLDDPIELAGPYGQFKVPQADSPILLVFDGNGYGAIVSILNYLSKLDDKRSITLLQIDSTEKSDLKDYTLARFTEMDLAWHRVTTTEVDDAFVDNLLTDCTKCFVYLYATKDRVKLIRKHLLLKGVKAEHLNYLYLT
ncbi:MULTISPECIES: 2Fe-2S iron-sulfur cluster-binding protein [unclassified Fusibacter]|uniref:2Fe-2S iron-sulfur cluster-binding protein n=1 Tax=unclassified Fusibacter TaxID=2624464 RepID=UPI0010115E0D|nr:MULTISPECIES: 2Fe-2S iron-sulfur cluster-binding protein [unclassified Fusibacter]MCK8060328.1 2Fe-2S iron-sulfur cluster-binding protein [Fusibacter sp. A2]NPE20383.1 2Fe-2S iron-sulfur cluster binding domain-containing protein [Fusibacter sp. A1]RXV63588.1 hypothetical protein DWB64_01025 [Fusibacter sp. A1]